MNDYGLSVLICAVDETTSLKRTFDSIKDQRGVCEFIFILSRTASAGCVNTVIDICRRDDCRWFYQSGKGLGNAIKDGIAAAKGTHVVIWSADDAIDPAAFEPMVNASILNPDKIIKLSRWLRKDSFKGYGTIRSLINIISQKGFSVLFRSDLTDYTAPIQTAPLSVYRKIKWENDGFPFLMEMTLKPLKMGCEFIELPCVRKNRTEGESHSSFRELAKYYYVALKTAATPRDKLIDKEA